MSNILGVLEGVLAFLIETDTTSSREKSASRPTRPLFEKIQAYFSGIGAETWLQPETDAVVCEHYGDQATLIVRIGPRAVGGMLISGHGDVVPAIESDWETKPFELTYGGEKQAYFGRGAIDMKGSLANMIVAGAMLAEAYGNDPTLLRKPLYLVFSWGEEIGCLGTKSAVEALLKINVSPELILVAEPTNMEIVTAHKGSIGLSFRIQGISGHSSNPKNGINADIYGTELRSFLDEYAAELAGQYSNSDFNYPHPVLNLGRYESGTAGNIIPGHASGIIHIRTLPGMNPDEIIARIENKCREIEAKIKNEATEKKLDQGRVGCVLHVLSKVPPLFKKDLEHDSLLARFSSVLQELLVQNTPAGTVTKDYTTEAGGFQRAFPNSLTVVCHPGDPFRNHAHDRGEFISRDELLLGLQLMQRMAFSFCGNEQALSSDVVQNIIVPTGLMPLERIRQI